MKIHISLVEEVSPLLDNIVNLLHASKYPDKVVFGIRLALEEGLVNAIKHGNHSNPGKSVMVHYQITQNQSAFEIKDEGEGFDPEQVPDPTLSENLDKASGRGILLMKHYMNVVKYNNNRLTLLWNAMATA